MVKYKSISFLGRSSGVLYKQKFHGAALLRLHALVDFIRILQYILINIDPNFEVTPLSC